MVVVVVVVQAPLMVSLTGNDTAKYSDVQSVFRCVFADTEGKVRCPSNRLPAEVAFAILRLMYVFVV